MIKLLVKSSREFLNQQLTKTNIGIDRKVKQK